MKEYAQRLVSTPGTQDGLYWATVDDDVEPRGPRPDAAPRRADAGRGAAGVVRRVHLAHPDLAGVERAGGAYSYVINGRTIAGFALLAVPAVHRNTGVMSFLVSNQGKVYEKDLGADTLKVAATITSFDPDPSWREVDEATLRTAAATSPEDVPFTGQVERVEGAGRRDPRADRGRAFDPAEPGARPRGDDALDQALPDAIARVELRPARDTSRPGMLPASTLARRADARVRSIGRHAGAVATGGPAARGSG